MTQETELHALIGAIYDAALDPSCWPTVLQGVTKLMHATAATLICEVPEVGLSGIMASEGMDPAAIAAYEQHYVEQDLSLQEGLRQPVGMWVSTADFVSIAHYKKTEFYCDFMQPAGLGHVAGSMLSKRSGQFASLGFHRPLGRSAFDLHDARLYRLIQPHFERALAIHCRLAAAAQKRSPLIELFDRLAMGVVLFDAQGKTLHVNAAASALASLADGFEVQRSEVLAATAVATTRIRSLLLEALGTHNDEGIDPAGSLLLDRPSGRRPFEVFITSLGRERVKVGSRPAAAVLFIRDSEDKVLPAEDLLMQQYGLTAAEAGFAVALLKGGTVAETAEMLSISVNTARTHLKRIFSKTGTSRQSELVSLLGSGPLTYLR